MKSKPLSQPPSLLSSLQPSDSIIGYLSVVSWKSSVISYYICLEYCLFKSVLLWGHDRHSTHTDSGAVPLLQWRPSWIIRLTQVLTAYTFFIHLTPSPTSAPHDRQTSKSKWHPKTLSSESSCSQPGKELQLSGRTKQGFLLQIPPLPRLGDILIYSKQELNLAVSLKSSKWQEGSLQDEQSGAARGRPLKSQWCRLMRPAKERHTLEGVISRPPFPHCSFSC